MEAVGGCLVNCKLCEVQLVKDVINQRPLCSCPKEFEELYVRGFP